MRISEKIEVGYEDDFFAGCEMVNELSAVIVGDFGQDNGGVASRVGLWGGRRVWPRSVHMCTPPPGGGVGMLFSCMWGRSAIRFAGRERTKLRWQRNARSQKKLEVAL